MPSLQVTRTSSKSMDSLWQVISDFPNIADWYSGVSKSDSTSNRARGVGATRHCELSPAGALDERILEWEEGRRVQIAVEQATMAPIKRAVADFQLREVPEGVELSIDYEFVPKGGAVGQAVSPALRLAFTKAFTKMLNDWEAAA